MVKSKLSPCSGTVALRQLNPIHKKGPESFFLSKKFFDQKYLILFGIKTVLLHIQPTCTFIRRLINANNKKILFTSTFEMKAKSIL